jgi:alkanesulfonate monooxygenase SsuD/methylene tetrahydromethanopterin reductase-like flavin-dependent oxidoreductase (luciferase family)
MRFALSIPQRIPDGAFDPARLRDYLTRAEELGFQSAWTQEAVLGSAPTLAPLELMTFAAACTERLRLGCAVFVSPLHNPVHLAKSISTLDQLSRGRIEVGIGTGGKGRMFSAFEVDPTSFVARFTEGVRLMKACWTEPHISFSGRFWQLDDASMEPNPFQKPYPPLWIGGNHPAAIRPARCATAQGSLVLVAPPPRSSPSRFVCCVLHWLKHSRTRRHSQSPNGSTSLSMTT